MKVCTCIECVMCNAIYIELHCYLKIKYGLATNVNKNFYFLPVIYPIYQAFVQCTVIHLPQS